MLLVQLEEAVLAAFEAGRTNRSGGDEDCSEPRLLPAHSSWGHWGQTWGGSAESPTAKVLRAFLPLLTEPKADHLGSWKTIEMQNKMLLKTVPYIAKHLKKPGHGLKYIKIIWMLFVKIILSQEGSKHLTTQKCHRCTRECLSIILFIPACKSRRDCQILCSDLCCHPCTSLREPRPRQQLQLGFVLSVLSRLLMAEEC